MRQGIGRADHLDVHFGKVDACSGRRSGREARPKMAVKSEKADMEPGTERRSAFW